jgi:Fe-S-cluster containining protein
MPDSSPEARPTMMKASFRLPVAGGSVQASAAVPAGRTTLTALLPIIQNLENAIVGRMAEEAREAGSPISCREGCAACCRQMVAINFFEAEALYAWFQGLPEDGRAELEKRFDGAMETLREEGVMQLITENDRMLDREEFWRIALAYIHADVACPFLVEERCSIYPIRPLICREHMVVSPPEHCWDPGEREVTGVDLPLKLSNVLFQFGRQTEGSERGWIPLVFLLAWGRRGVKPGERASGSGEEVLRMFLAMAEAVCKADSA